MAKSITLNGEKFLSLDELLNILTEVCVNGSSVDDLYICESERDNLAAVQDICNNLEGVFPGIKRAFKTRYIQERFVKRTLGV